MSGGAGTTNTARRRRRGSSLHPTVPPAVEQLMLDEPVDDASDVGAQPHAVGDGPSIDAAVNLAAPVRQVLVLPARVLGEEFGRAPLAQDSPVKSPLSQRVQRPWRRRPWLPGTLCRLGVVEVEVCGKECAASPLAVRLLQCE